MTPSEAVKSRADIGEVAEALGCSVRGNRMIAAYRDGKKFSVSLDRDKGVFCDHKIDEGGDVFDLVKLCLGCDFREALKWLADFYGVEYRHPNPKALRNTQALRQRAQSGLRFVIYSLRHTFATRFYDLTKDLAALQELLGHSRIDTTMRYINDSQERMDRAMALFEEKTLARQAPETLQ